MEQLAPADVVQAMKHGRIIGHDIQDDYRAFDLLTQDGPCFPLGQIRVEGWAWCILPDIFLHFAIHLHWCGTWGGVCPVDRQSNDEAVESSRGQIVSCWYPPEPHPMFWVRTELNDLEVKTDMFIALDA